MKRAQDLLSQKPQSAVSMEETFMECVKDFVDKHDSIKKALRSQKRKTSLVPGQNDTDVVLGSNPHAKRLTDSKSATTSLISNTVVKTLLQILKKPMPPSSSKASRELIQTTGRFRKSKFTAFG